VKRVLIAVDLPDNARMPEIGEGFYVDNSHYEDYNGLHGEVVEIRPLADED
jgi:hypothetical protein